MLISYVKCFTVQRTAVFHVASYYIDNGVERKKISQKDIYQSILSLFLVVPSILFNYDQYNNTFPVSLNGGLRRIQPLLSFSGTLTQIVPGLRPRTSFPAGLQVNRAIVRTSQRNVTHSAPAWVNDSPPCEINRKNINRRLMNNFCPRMK